MPTKQPDGKILWGSGEQAMLGEPRADGEATIEMGEARLPTLDPDAEEDSVDWPRRRSPEEIYADGEETIAVVIRLE